jgi:hypothetical protein
MSKCETCANCQPCPEFRIPYQHSTAPKEFVVNVECKWNIKGFPWKEDCDQFKSINGSTSDSPEEV